MRGLEDGQAVIDKQGAFRGEGLRGLEARPEGGILLWRVEKMGRIARIEMHREPHLLVLDRQRRGVGVRDEDPPFAAFLELQKEFLGSRQIAHLIESRALDVGDVEAQFAAPVIDAIPLHGAAGRVKSRLEEFQRIRPGQTVLRRVAVRYEFLPEPIVETQIEQRSIHVQQHGVNLGPVDPNGIHLLHLRIIPTDEKPSRFGRSPDTHGRASGRRHHANLRRRLHGAAQGRRLAADPG
jgi:hypothetical protein